MLNTSVRACCGTIKNCNSVLPLNKPNAVTTYNLGQVLVRLGQQARTYGSKQTDDPRACCNQVSQTAGRKVEKWPQVEDAQPGWRAKCPVEPPPPNYDPYKIKVPEIVVPPLQPCNVKDSSEESRQLFDTPEINLSNVTNSNIRDLFHNSPILHPDYWRDKPPKRISYRVEVELPRLGYHGKTKYKYAFHEPWKPLDRVTLLAQAQKEEDGDVVPAKTEEEATLEKQFT